jgi:hypothetical protein
MKHITKKLISTGFVIVFLFSGFLCTNAFSKTISKSDIPVETLDKNINFKITDVQYTNPPPVQDHTFFDAYVELEGEISEALSVDVYFYFDGVKKQENSVEFESEGAKTKTASFVTAFPNTFRHRIKIVVDPNKQYEDEETNREDNTWSSVIQAPKTKISFISLFEVFELQFFKRFIKLFA